MAVYCEVCEEEHEDVCPIRAHTCQVCSSWSGAYGGKLGPNLARCSYATIGCKCTGIGHDGSTCKAFHQRFLAGIQDDGGAISILDQPSPIVFPISRTTELPYTHRQGFHAATNPTSKQDVDAESPTTLRQVFRQVFRKVFRQVFRPTENPTRKQEADVQVGGRDGNVASPADNAPCPICSQSYRINQPHQCGTTCTRCRKYARENNTMGKCQFSRMGCRCNGRGHTARKCDKWHFEHLRGGKPSTSSSYNAESVAAPSLGRRAVTFNANETAGSRTSQLSTTSASRMFGLRKSGRVPCTWCLEDGVGEQFHLKVDCPRAGAVCQECNMAIRGGHHFRCTAARPLPLHRADKMR